MIEIGSLQEWFLYLTSLGFDPDLFYILYYIYSIYLKNLKDMSERIIMKTDDDPFQEFKLQFFNPLVR